MTSETEDLVRIGQLLKAAREELGYSQKHVADDAGISRLRYHDIVTAAEILNESPCNDA